MSTKNWIRTFVVVAIITWPAVETYRLWWTNQRLAEAQALEQQVTAKLEAAKAKSAQVAHADTSTTTPAKP